jgi:hypothetical protein
MVPLKVKNTFSGGLLAQWHLMTIARCAGSLTQLVKLCGMEHLEMIILSLAIQKVQNRFARTPYFDI